MNKGWRKRDRIYRQRKLRIERQTKYKYRWIKQTDYYDAWSMSKNQGKQTDLCRSIKRDMKPGRLKR